MEESISGPQYQKPVGSSVGIYEFTEEQQDRVLEILSRNVSNLYRQVMLIFFRTYPLNHQHWG